MSRSHVRGARRRAIGHLGIAALVLSILCALAGVGVIVHDISSAHTGRGPTSAEGPTTAPAPTLTLDDGDQGTQVLGLEINPQRGPTPSTAPGFIASTAPASTAPGSGNADVAAPGFAVTSTGAVFTLSHLVPKDVSTAGANLEVAGTGGTVTLSTANVVSTACADCPSGVGTAVDLASHLLLTVHDDTENVTVYGPLAPLGLLGATTVCGGAPELGCAGWIAGETHHFTFTLTFPNGSGEDAYQGTGASVDFVWTRN